MVNEGSEDNEGDSDGEGESKDYHLVAVLLYYTVSSPR
jgi:hypothetical protein